MTSQPEVETLTELRMPEALRRAIAEAYVPNDNPIMMGYVDEDGRPGMSYRGSVVPFSDSQIGVWARNSEGSTARALDRHPNVVLVWRESGGPGQRSRAVVTFRGRGRVDNSEAARKQVYETMPQRERDSDPEMKGVAIIVDLDSVSGFIPGFRLQMKR